MCRATSKSLTYKLGTVQLKETKEYFGSRGSETSSKINVFSSLISSVASTTDKWTVLEQFQTTAEMDFFIVGAPSLRFICNATMISFGYEVWGYPN